MTDLVIDYAGALTAILELDGMTTSDRVAGMRVILENLISDSYHEGQQSMVLDYSLGRKEGMEEAREAVFALLQEIG